MVFDLVFQTFKNSCTYIFSKESLVVELDHFHKEWLGFGTRIKGNNLSEVNCSSWNPQYCYVENSVELWHLFTTSKIHIFQEKKFRKAYP